MRLAIEEGKNTKAPGPDSIYTEHIKETIDFMQDFWINLMNKCLEIGVIPENWRTLTLKILYKGKGDTKSPVSFRGVVLENTTLKMFSKIINDRHVALVDQDILLPNQIQEREEYSSSYLIEQIEEALRHLRGKYYTVLVDFKKAFD